MLEINIKCPDQKTRSWGEDFLTKETGKPVVSLRNANYRAREPIFLVIAVSFRVDLVEI